MSHFDNHSYELIKSNGFTCTFQQIYENEEIKLDELFYCTNFIVLTIALTIPFGKYHGTIQYFLC